MNDTASRWCVLWCLVFLALGCDDLHYGSASAFDDAGGDFPEGTILCETHRDCPDSQFCVGPAGCSETWFCQSENPCSAAPPNFYCSCDGVVFNDNAGCPGQRYASTINSNTHLTGGERCDPENPEAFRFDLSIEGKGFEAFEGLIVNVRLHDPVVGMVVFNDSRFIEAGAFLFDWRDTFNPDYFGYFVDFFIDTRDTRTCEPGIDPSWRAFADNDFDFEKAHISLSVSAEDEPTPGVCEGW